MYLRCNFENDLCWLRNSNETDFFWTRTRSDTLDSIFNKPNFDHTLLASNVIVY